ncbi:MAG TPA: SDR family oxidoreductase, partial [Anaerolineales bacterium]|nr:SDR family oxidoreductase [Anaerolineales bacterium]
MIKSVVITGSTHGIGYHLAAAFLERECQVTISGRTKPAVDEAVARLSAKYSPERILGVACDVTDFNQVQHLWSEAENQFGRVEIWINNAGTASPRLNFWDVPPELYDEVVRANVIGTMYGAKVALTGMLAQGYGALYNMEGFGARGGGMQGMTLYGSTKAAVHFTNKSLAQEVQGTPVITGAIAPGMMITEMITRQYVGRETELEKAKPILNIIAERPETVAPVL